MDIKLSGKQDEFLTRISSLESTFLTGKAGTGKSFIVKKAMEEMKNAGLNVVAIAPTGIAANNIGGQTIHSLFNLTIHGVLSFESCSFLKGEKRKMLDKIDVIFIDEVSMLRPDILDAMNWTLLKNGCKGLDTKQIVFIGDLKQLQAPIDDNFMSMLLSEYNSFEFFNAKIYEKLDVGTIELDFIHRQNDLEFIENLNIIREGQKSQYFKRFLSSKTKGIVLAPHNSTVAKYNKIGLKSVEGTEYTYTAVIDGNVKTYEFNVEQEIKVKDGCKIMYLVNSKENPLVNGTLGIFRIHSGNPHIEVNGTSWLIESREFEKKEYIFNQKNNKLELVTIGSIEQIPIKLAYALTIHKSQGLTFEEVTLDLSIPCFVKGQLYTALSRVSSPEGLRIII